MKKVITSKNAPEAIGPYSQARLVDDLIFVSGQLPIDAKDGSMPDDISEQTKKSLENIKAILQEVGTDMDRVVKTTVLLKDINDFNAMNEVYKTFFNEVYPTRVCYEVSNLPKDAKVEIDCIAYIKKF